MNPEDAFEKRLRGAAPRQVPASWRNEILGALPEARPSNLVAEPGIADFLRTLLWPHPKAWAGLCAAWLLILGLNFSGHEPTGTEVTRLPARPSPQMRELLREQEQLLAELSGTMDPFQPRRSESVVPKPQSCRESETVNA
jgi:hypothetical protein